MAASSGARVGVGWVVLAAALLSLSPAFAAAAVPTEFAPNDPARIWFAQLGSADSDVRDKSIENLMGLSRARLPALRGLVAASRPLSAAQLAALHAIVTQVYLSGEPYPVDSGGFLGLRWLGDYFSNDPTPRPVTPAGDRPDFPCYRFINDGGFLGMQWPDQLIVEDEPPRLGVPVGVLLPGFPCYRFLRAGDMVVGVLVEPDLPLNRLPNMRTPTRSMLISAVGQAGAGRSIELEVLRSGELLRVPITLAPRPMLSGMNDIYSFFIERQSRADRFWQTQFVPLLTIS